MALTKIKTGGIADNAITNAKMADDAIDSADFANASIDLAHMSVNSIDSDQYVDGSIDNVHLAGSIAVSKTLLAGGTGLTLSTNTLAVDAAQTQITSVGTLTSLTSSGSITQSNGNHILSKAGNQYILKQTSGDLRLKHEESGSGNIVFELADGGKTHTMANDGSTTFGGTILVKPSGDNVSVFESDAGDVELKLDSGGANKDSILGFLDDGAEKAKIKYDSSATNWEFHTVNGTTLTLDASKNATFAGSLTATTIDTSRSTEGATSATIGNTHASGLGLYIRGASGTNRAFNIRDYTNNNDLFYVQGNGNATFAKAVTIGDSSGSDELLVQGGSFPVARINNMGGGETGIRFRSYENGSNQLHADIKVQETGDETGTFKICMPHSVDAITIDGSSNSTFGGTATLGTNSGVYSHSLKFNTFSGRMGSEGTVSVAQSATVIWHGSNKGSFVIVTGVSGSERFFDVVAYGGGTSGVTVISSANGDGGHTKTRSYSHGTGGDLSLTMSGATWDVTCLGVAG